MDAVHKVSKLSFDLWLLRGYIADSLRLCMAFAQSFSMQSLSRQRHYLVARIKRRLKHISKDVEIPLVARFRNNLVRWATPIFGQTGAHFHDQSALSRYRNLLFIAYLDKVYVYTPSFPEQIVTTKPQLVIEIPRSRPGLTGCVDPNEPHAINHLIVGDIGDEEVLVVACDDGDVVSYTVRSLSVAMEEGATVVHGLDESERAMLIRPQYKNSILPLADPANTSLPRLLIPWFHENVGKSAWGLALHKSAMLLAVSSNTHCIYVFAPALGREGDGPFHETYGPLINAERYPSWETTDLFALKDRPLGRRITLQGHAANIPNIAFCDNDLDPEGKYLASTDIEGYTKIWDIWQGTQILERLDNSGSCYGNPELLGWGVACLDPRTSRIRYVIQDISSSYETCFEGRGRSSALSSLCFPRCHSIVGCTLQELNPLLPKRLFRHMIALYFFHPRCLVLVILTQS